MRILELHVKYEWFTGNMYNSCILNNTQAMCVGCIIILTKGFASIL